MRPEPIRAAAILRAMLGFGAAQPTIYAPSWYLTPELLLAMAAGIIGSTPIVHALSRQEGSPGVALRPALANVALVVLLVASVMLIAARTYNPFIYFRF